MTSLDIEKLVKVLMLTDSPNEGEAVNAMKAANRMLKSAGLRWTDVVNIKKLSAVSSKELPDPPRYAQWNGHGQQAMTPEQAAPFAYYQSMNRQNYGGSMFGSGGLF